jgi:hypothetical protein
MSNIGSDYEAFVVAPNAAGVTIREATGDDHEALARLAQLDSTRPLGNPEFRSRTIRHPEFRSRNSGVILIAEVHGELRAAYSLSEGRTIADPFHRTAELIDLLMLRANHLNGGTRRTKRASAAPQPPGLGLALSPRGLLGRRAA